MIQILFHGIWENSSFGREIVNKENILARNLSRGTFMVFLFLFLFLGRPPHSYSAQNRPGASISFSFGYFQPKEKAFKELYGNNKFQMNFNVRYALKKNLSLYSGLRYLSCEGETEIVGPEFQEEKYALKFTMYSIPFAFLYSSAYKNVYPFFGGGLSYNIYREEWDQIGISFKDKKIGLLLLGGVEYFIWEKFSLLARFQYSSIATKQGAELDENINLGGTEFSLGFSFYF